MNVDLFELRVQWHQKKNEGSPWKEKNKNEKKKVLPHSPSNLLVLKCKQAMVLNKVEALSHVICTLATTLEIQQTVTNSYSNRIELHQSVVNFPLSLSLSFLSI